MRASRWWKCSVSAVHGRRRYFSRLATTKPPSRNGTARITSGPTSAIKAFVLSVPCTAMQPSSSPRRFEPLSPMNTDAGWKFQNRNPSAAPAVRPASTPAASRWRTNAMLAKTAALIVHPTPATPPPPGRRRTRRARPWARERIAVGAAPAAPHRCLDSDRRGLGQVRVERVALGDRGGALGELLAPRVELRGERGGHHRTDLV